MSSFYDRKVPMYYKIYMMYKQFGRYIRLRLRGVPTEVLKNAGPNFRCGRGAFFRKKENIIIGSNVFMGNFVHISAPCIIKNDVLIASYVSFVGGDHRFNIAGYLMNESGRDNMKPIILEEDVWIGHGSIVLTGTVIRRGAILAAGSVATKEIPPCTIYGGVPARYVKDRFKTMEEKGTVNSFV